MRRRNGLGMHPAIRRFSRSLPRHVVQRLRFILSFYGQRVCNCDALRKQHSPGTGTERDRHRRSTR